MEDFEKHEARNYLSAAGFFLLSVCALLFVFTHFNPALITEAFTHVNAVIGLSLILIGILLATIGGRGFTAVTFLLMGMYTLVLYFAPSIQAVTGIALIILSLVLLSASDKKKYLTFPLPLLLGLIPLLQTFITPTAGFVCDLLLAILSLWYAFASLSERVHFPAGTVLKSDDETDFKSSGSVLGYLLFALICGAWGLYYILTENVIPLEGVCALVGVCSLMMVLTGILLAAVAKMRFTPVFFILIGIFSALSLYVSGILVILIGALYIILGVFAFLREESRLLPGLMLILYGIISFVSVLITGNFSFGTFQGIFNLIPAAIAIYIAFAVFSARKLPLF